MGKYNVKNTLPVLYPLLSPMAINHKKLLDGQSVLTEARAETKAPPQHPHPQYLLLDALWQQRKPREQLSQCVYSGSISGSVFMLSIIQLVAPSWAALPGGDSAHWSYAVGESRADTHEGKGVKQKKEQWREKKSRGRR